MIGGEATAAFGSSRGFDIVCWQREAEEVSPPVAPSVSVVSSFRSVPISSLLLSLSCCPTDVTVDVREGGRDKILTLYSQGVSETENAEREREKKGERERYRDKQSLIHLFLHSFQCRGGQVLLVGIHRPPIQPFPNLSSLSPKTHTHSIFHQKPSTHT